jgi:hypothetical protein
MESTGKPISFDRMLDALGDVQRRKLLIALLEHNPQDDRPAVIAGSDTEDDVADRLLDMRHNHLPKLTAYGLIEWDRGAHEVLKGRNFDEVEPLLELLKAHEEELVADWL